MLVMPVEVMELAVVTMLAVPKTTPTSPEIRVSWAVEKPEWKKLVMPMLQKCWN